MGRGPGRPGQRQGQVQDTGVWSRVKEAPPPLGSPRQLQFAFASKRGQALPFGPGVFEVSYSGPNALLFVASFQTPPACRHAVPVPVPVVAPQPSHPALLSGHRAAVSRGPGAAPPPPFSGFSLRRACPAPGLNVGTTVVVISLFCQVPYRLFQVTLAFTMEDTRSYSKLGGNSGI